MGFLLSLPCDVTALKNAFAFALCSPAVLRKAQIGCLVKLTKKTNADEK